VGGFARDQPVRYPCIRAALDHQAGRPNAPDVRSTINESIAELERDEYQAGGLDPLRSYDVKTIGAPVFERQSA
jgi:hypothetical protein